MIDYRLLFHLLAGLIFVVTSISACQRYLKWRTKYNLAVLVVYILLFVGTILHLFYPYNLDFIGGRVVQNLFIAIFIVLLLAFLLYPYMIEFFNRRKIKN